MFSKRLHSLLHASVLTTFHRVNYDILRLCKRKYLLLTGISTKKKRIIKDKKVQKNKEQLTSSAEIHWVTNSVISVDTQSN